MDKNVGRNKENGSGYLYKVNPTCPACGEEHAWFRVELTEEQHQQVLNQYNELKQKRKDGKRYNELAILLMEIETPLVLEEREFKCPACGSIFKAQTSVVHSDRLGSRWPGMVPYGEKFNG